MRNLQILEQPHGVLTISGRCNRPRNFVGGEVLQQVVGPGKRCERRNAFSEKRVVPFFEACESRLAFGMFAKQLVDEMLSVHSDAAMNFPCRDGDSLLAQRRRPGGYVIVNAVNQRSIEIE